MSQSKKVFVKESDSSGHYIDLDKAEVQGRQDYLKIIEYNQKNFSDKNFIKFLDNEVKCNRLKKFYESLDEYYLDVIPKFDFLESFIEFDETPVDI